MKLIYEGTDITSYVDMTRCVHRDVSGGRSDCADITLQNAETWYRWKPQTDDTLEVVCGGYSTGKLFMSAVLPKNGEYRILATSLPSSARHKAYASYEKMGLNDLIAACAAECGLRSAQYGVGEMIYPYLLRRNEGAAAFLSRILAMEGAMLKAANGQLSAIAIDYAQRREAAQTLHIGAAQEGASYRRRDGERLASMTIRTPYAEGRAEDEAAAQGRNEIRTDLPAVSSAEAGRWARGTLLMHNRMTEELEITGMAYNPGLTALERIDIDGGADASGEWLIDEVTHDFVRLKSTAVLRRCVRTIR